MQRDTCIFYRSFLTAAEMIPDINERFELLTAIIRYSLDQQEPSFSHVTCSIAWELIKPVIDKEWTSYINGKKGGCPRGTKKPSMIGNKNAAKSSRTQNPNKTQTKADIDLDKDYDVDVDAECNAQKTHSLSAKKCGGLSVVDETAVYDDVDSEIMDMRCSHKWSEHVFMRFKFLNLNEQLLEEYLQKWGQEVKISGKHHQNLADDKHHFMSWMIIQEEKLNKNSKKNGTDGNNGYRTREDIYKGTIRIMSELKDEGSQPHEELPVV